MTLKKTLKCDDSEEGSGVAWSLFSDFSTDLRMFIQDEIISMEGASQHNLPSNHKLSFYAPVLGSMFCLVFPQNHRKSVIIFLHYNVYMS